MVLLKGKTSSEQIKSTEGREPIGMSKFKVYSEKKKVYGRSNDNSDAKSSKLSLVSKKGTIPARNTGLKTKVHASGAEVTRSGYVDKTRVGRKALADVSNFRNQSSKFEKPSGSRCSMTFGTISRNASSSRSLVGKVKANLSHGVTASNFSVKASAKAPRTSSTFHRVQVNKATETLTRQISKSNNTITRKSCQSDYLQGHLRSVEKPTTKVGFPVKPRAGGVLIPQVSNQGKVPKGKLNDGVTLKALKNQTTKDALGGMRKSVKPSGRSSFQMSNDQKGFKLKSMCNLEKLGTTYARRVKVVSSLDKTSSTTSSSENVAEKGIPVQGGDTIKPESSETTTSKKSSRRKSYTSSLISRSKLLKSCKEVREQEQLPNIDDEGNPLEVAEYVDDIYEYYWIMEAQSAPLENHMMVQMDVTPQMRGLLINWLIEVHLKFDLMPETLYLTVTLLDRYLLEVTIKKKEFQLVGLASLLLASKYEDFWHPRVKDLISISAEPYTREQVLEMEKSILKKLKFRLNLPTAYVFMLRFLKASQSDKRHEHLAFYLIELCLVEYETLRFRPSLLCASAVYVARCTLNEVPAWTPLLGKHARYEELQIRDCAEVILRIHKAASAGILKVTYDKYSQPEFSSVAAVRPLDNLPP